jgi:hypothetical protein
VSVLRDTNDGSEALKGNEGMIIGQGGIFAFACAGGIASKGRTVIRTKLRWTRKHEYRSC